MIIFVLQNNPQNTCGFCNIKNSLGEHRGSVLIEPPQECSITCVDDGMMVETPFCNCEFLWISLISLSYLLNKKCLYDGLYVISTTPYNVLVCIQADILSNTKRGDKFVFFFFFSDSNSILVHQTHNLLSMITTLQCNWACESVTRYSSTFK